jgi:6-phosphofructokinase 1
MKIGILTSGGDCPGINATIRGVGKSAINNYGMEVIGIQNGFSGLLYKDVIDLSDASLSGILNLGGTILGTAREKVFRKKITSPDEKDQEEIKKCYHELGRLSSLYRRKRYSEDHMDALTAGTERCGYSQDD